MRHTFHSEQWLPYPVERVFAFLANPDNLPRLMPTWQKAQIEEASFVSPPARPADDPILPMTVTAGIGSHMTLSFKPLPYSPIRVPWEVEITEFVWNDHFCDRQLRGPFAYWSHCHTVRSEHQANTSGTLLSDDIEYEIPLGKFGELAQRLITRQLRNTFAYRHVRTSDLVPRLSTRH
jgi:ligand-binding SRPBCC domain-containing protein